MADPKMPSPGSKERITEIFETGAKAREVRRANAEKRLQAKALEDAAEAKFFGNFPSELVDRLKNEKASVDDLFQFAGILAEKYGRADLKVYEMSSRTDGILGSILSVQLGWRIFWKHAGGKDNALSLRGQVETFLDKFTIVEQKHNPEVGDEGTSVYLSSEYQIAPKEGSD